jgi:plastocyanin
MKLALKPFFVAGALALPLAASLPAPKVLEIRIEADPATDTYRFVPDRISAKAGDVLRFQVASGPPHSVVFEGKDLSTAARAALNAAMPARFTELASPTLREKGARYEITIPAALPAGRYPFFCLTHRAYDMRGELTVTR